MIDRTARAAPRTWIVDGGRCPPKGNSGRPHRPLRRVPSGAARQLRGVVGTVRSVILSRIGILRSDAPRTSHRPADRLPARPHRARRARRGPRRRRGAVGRDQRQGHHERGLLPDRLLPAVHPHDEPHPGRPGQAQGPPQGRREGAQRPRRPARRLVVPLVSYERRGSAALLTIERPERRNAIDGATAAALLEGFERFRGDDGARVFVLTGAGEEAFCAGADLKAIGTLDADAPGGPLGFTRLASPKPTVAAVSGWCLAGGFELALWCDLRVAT